MNVEKNTNFVLGKRKNFSEERCFYLFFGKENIR
jgi:hypothetical protein